MSMRWFPGTAILLALLASSAATQTRTGGFAASSVHGHFVGRSFSTGRAHRIFRPAHGYYCTPFFYSDYYQPDQLEYIVPEPQPSPIPATQVKDEPVPDPELLELHGNQWVRVTAFTQAVEGTPTPAPAKVLPPAVLVFRDGHAEEVSSYSIIGTSIYAKSNYWSTGKWTRKIHIAELDVPATISRNEQRGLNFELPSGPDEIMIRP
jgi:hypothetical protein